MASFETVHPLGIEHVRIAKLIKFRHDHEEERTRFHLEIAKLAKDLGSIDHPDQVKDAVQPHAKIVKENTEILKRRLTGLGLECTRNIFTFSIPGWLVANAATHGILASDPYLWRVLVRSPSGLRLRNIASIERTCGGRARGATSCRSATTLRRDVPRRTSSN